MPSRKVNKMAAEPELLYIDNIVTQSIGAQRKIVVLVVSWFYRVEHNLKIWFNNTGRDCDGRICQDSLTLARIRYDSL